MVFRASEDGRLRCDARGIDVRCAIGKSGIVPASRKREGDGASPGGIWAMRRVFYRPDRMDPPKTKLPVVPLRPQDGWCDDPADPLYNRPVTLPYPASCETLFRGDHVYDLIVELGHNDRPPIPGLGSAVFLHIAHDDYRGTEGCIALSVDDLLLVLDCDSDGIRHQIG